MPLFFFLFLILYLLFVIVIFVGLLLLCVYEIFTFSQVFVVFMNVQLNSIQLLLLLLVAGLFFGDEDGTPPHEGCVARRRGCGERLG